MKDPLPKDENIERDAACSSDNAAAGYAAALNRCKWHLREALEHLDSDRVHLAISAMSDAQNFMDEASRWFNHGNNSWLRIRALVAEIKALRGGAAISYASANDDPVNENWRGTP